MLGYRLQHCAVLEKHSLKVVKPCSHSRQGINRCRPRHYQPTTAMAQTQTEAQAQPRNQSSSGTSSSTSSNTHQIKSATTFHHGITYTSYETNSFVLKFQSSGVRLLVDPWLTGDLTFLDGKTSWLYRGRKTDLFGKVDIDELAREVDLLVLTQALDDHTHLPTLRLMPKDIPVVGNPSAIKKIVPLGFTNVRSLDHGESIDVCDGKLRIRATQGALVGPPWSKRQNGLVFQETAEGSASVYYEPHCDFVESSVKEVGQVDVCISPVKSALLKLGPFPYPLVMGDINLMKLVKLLRPKVLLPLLNSETVHEGPIKSLIVDRGEYDDVQKQLREAGLDTRVEFPAPVGEALSIAL